MWVSWPAPSRPRSGTGWRSWAGGGCRTRRRPGRRSTPGADTSSPQQVSVSDKSYHVYCLQMVQTVNAKNLWRQKLNDVLPASSVLNTFRVKWKQKPFSLFSKEEIIVVFFQVSFTFAMLASQMRTWDIAASIGMITLAKWPSVRYDVNYWENSVNYSDLTWVCKQVASHWQWNSLLFVGRWKLMNCS